MILRPAAAADLNAILAVEATPGHDAFINRQARADHEAQIASPAFAYLLAETEGAPVGFAILAELDDHRGNHLLKRIAVARPGHGLGTRLFRAVTDRAFGHPALHRLWLNVLSGNARARHVYAREGFTEEGRLREARPRPDGTREDVVVMSILRPEWRDRRAAGG